MYDVRTTRELMLTQKVMLIHRPGRKEHQHNKIAKICFRTIISEPWEDVQKYPKCARTSRRDFARGRRLAKKNLADVLLRSHPRQQA